MAEALARIQQLQREARGLPHGPTQVALLEEAARLADTLEDIPLAYRVREQLIEAAEFSGRPDVAIVTFSWCLAQFDRDPSRFDRHDILWKYKWIISGLSSFPEITLRRILDLLDDMERRYREAGSSLNAVWLLRRKLWDFVGDREKAREAHARYRKSRRDSLSDCAACVADSDSDYYSVRGQWRRTLDAVQPVLSGRLRCTTQPHRSLASALLPLLRLGRIDEAKDAHHRGYRLVSRHDHFVREHASHLEFLVLIGDMAKARTVLAKHLPGALKAVDTSDRFEFHLAARLWAARLAGRGTRRLKIRLPETLPAPDAAGMTDVAALGEWFTDRAREIALRFDARNGTDTFQRRLDALPSLLKLAKD